MSRSARFAAIALVAVLAVSLSGCGDRDVAARVNGEVIKKSLIDKQMEQVKKQYASMFEGADGDARLLDFRERLLDNAINGVLIRQAAKDEGITVTDADVDKKIEELKAGFANEEAFNQAIEKSGMKLEDLREQLRDQAVTTKLVEKLTRDVKVDDAAVDEYYEKNKEQFVEKAAVHASHILFSEDDKSTAEKVLTQVKNGGDFAELAKEYSKDTVSAANGGDLGWPTTPYVQEFQSAADKLEPGEVSDLVKSPFGWHIIKVVEKRGDRQKPLKEVREQISDILSQRQQAEAYQKYVDKLREKAKIEILDPELKSKKVDVEGSGGDKGSEGEKPAEGDGE
ncbi:MAG: peptidylprolyl isomerase [Coriobacteriia bacterium]|nr:peptidylprolyl isomerase [Coriobacteriia bacterium]